MSPLRCARIRALVVEAVVPNPAGRLKPGLFATALIEEASRRPGILVPATAIRTVAGTSRVFALSADHVEEHIVTLGQPVGELVEVTTGVKTGDVVATSNLNQLADGVRVAVAK